MAIHFTAREQEVRREEREACARLIDDYRRELCGGRWSLEASVLRHVATLVRARGDAPSCSDDYPDW